MTWLHSFFHTFHYQSQVSLCSYAIFLPHIFLRKRSYHIHTYMWRLAFVRIIYGVFLSYWFAGKHCERCEVYCIHIILLAPLWERLCWVLNLVANGVWFPDSGFVTQSGRSCLHGRQQHHSPAAGGRSLLTLLLLLGHQLTRTHHPWPCHDGMGLLGRLGVLAVRECETILRRRWLLKDTSNQTLVQACS